MELHFGIGTAALDDEGFVCVPHHAVLRRTEGKALMVVGPGDSCNGEQMKGYSIYIYEGCTSYYVKCQLKSGLIQCYLLKNYV